MFCGAERKMMSVINSNSVSLAGEFAVLSQLALRGYDANMTLGRTKGVDILVSNPKTVRMLKLEVKTNFRSSRSAGSNSRLFGHFLSAWMMNEKHEAMRDRDLFYCFVNISEDTKQFRFFIVPSRIVADYVSTQHKIWLDEKATHSRENTMRMFRIGYANEKYSISTPTADDYEDNWSFLNKVSARKSRKKPR
jgi:hypothetical protein